jgi:DNA-binding CsgD family transcriptional regulator
MTILGNLATVSVAEASEAAAEQFDEAATLARDLGDRFSLSMILANSLLTIGRDDPRAMSRMEEALAIQRDLGPSQYLVWMELSAIEILLVAGRSDDAANRLAAIIDLVRGFGTWQERAQTASVVACLLHARGRDMLAAVALGIWDQTWRDARDGETRQNDPTGDPWLDSVIDRIQRTLGPVRFDAEHARGRAIESAVALDRLVELIALPAAEVTPGDGPFGRLSARELEVFELVGRGQTDPEIAHALSISAKTVSVHVANIKAKIGAEARIDVAMAARTRETNTG